MPTSMTWSLDSKNSELRTTYLIGQDEDSAKCRVKWQHRREAVALWVGYGQQMPDIVELTVLLEDSRQLTAEEWWTYRRAMPGWHTLGLELAVIDTQITCRMRDMNFLASVSGQLLNATNTLGRIQRVRTSIFISGKEKDHCSETTPTSLASSFMK